MSAKHLTLIAALFLTIVRPVIALAEIADCLAESLAEVHETEARLEAESLCEVELTLSSTESYTPAPVDEAAWQPTMVLVWSISPIDLGEIQTGLAVGANPAIVLPKNGSLPQVLRC